MNQPFKRCCANCTSFDAAEQCCDNAVTFIDPVTRQYRPRVPDDDCCHDHERKPVQLRIVQGGGDDHDLH
jgi:hypothetical protein